MQLDEVQMFLIGLVASVIVIVLRWLSEKRDWHPTKVQLTWGVFAVSVLLAFLWMAPTMPEFVKPLSPVWPESPGEIVVAFIALAGAYISAFLKWLDGFGAVAVALTGAATIVYNILLEKIVKGAPAAIEKFINPQIGQ